MEGGKVIILDFHFLARSSKLIMRYVGYIKHYPLFISQMTRMLWLKKLLSRSPSLLNPVALANPLSVLNG
jgi:hypothetical protein